MYRANFTIDLDDIKVPDYIKTKEDCKENISNWLWETWQLRLTGTHPDYLKSIISELFSYNNSTDYEAVAKFMDLIREIEDKNEN